MVFKLFGLVKGMVFKAGRGYGFQAIWSGIGSRLTGSLTKD